MDARIGFLDVVKELLSVALSVKSYLAVFVVLCFQLSAGLSATVREQF